MAVAADASSRAHANGSSTAEASFTWNHAGASSGVKGILVLVFQYESSSSDLAGTVTYDGTTVPAVSSGRAVDTASEPGSVKAYFLGSGVAQGTKAVVVNRTNNGERMSAMAFTVLASGDTEVTGVVLEDNNRAFAEVNVDDGSPGTNSLRVAGLFSGHNAVTSLTIGANSTALQTNDAGVAVSVTAVETTAGQGSRPVGYTAATEDAAAVYLAIKEAGAATQNLTGTLFTSAPSFPTGTVSPGAVALTGTLFTSAPTFPTGVVSQVGGTQNLTGALFTSAPTFFTGAVASTYALTGTLFTSAPTFFTGTVTPGAVALTGTLFSNTPTFNVGAVTNDSGPQTLTGALFTKAPTFNVGAVTSTYALAGSLFAKAPTFFAGSLQYYTNLLVVELDDGDPPPVDTDHWLRGNVRATAGTGWVRLRLYQGATLIAGFEFEPTGSFVTYEYELLEAEAATITDYDDLQIHVDVKAVTHPFTVEVDWVELERPVAVGQTLTGALFQNTPTFFAGTVSTAYSLTGTLFTDAPTFFAGTVTPGSVNLAGSLFTKAPTFFTGAITVGAVNLTGVLFQETPTFFTGTVSSGAFALTGVLFTKAPTFPQGTVTPGAVALTGVLFQSTPTFPTGAVTVGAANLAGVLFQNTPVFFTGLLATAGSLQGVLFQNTPVFFVGVVDLDTTGAFWTRNPAGYTLNPAAYTLNPAGYDPVGPDEIPPWGFEIYGTLFQKAPTFPVGAIS